MAMNRTNNGIRGMNVKSPPPANTAATLKRLWHYVGNARGKLLLVILLAATAAGLSLVGPFLTGRAIDQFIIPGNMQGLLLVCLMLLAAYVAGSLVSWLQAYILADVAQRTVWQLRKELFAHLQELPLGFFVSRSHGDLMSRTTNDVENVSVTLNQSMIQLVTSMISIIGSLSMMLYLNVWLTAAALLNIPLLFYITRKIAYYT
ncbi:MAG: multidrug ABC transporter ATP-binding protein, partial [Gorillibacterium sp.]|nr:multidrug ABC transporter ATP-binding protein [Gorillibacterium sp.]